MGYNPAPAEQWTQEDLDRAEEAQDYAAVTAARRAGHLHDLLNPAKDLADEERLAQVLTPPVGPTVPGQLPGSPGGSGYNSGAQMTQEDLDRLAAANDYAAINEARRHGRLTNLGA